MLELALLCTLRQPWLLSASLPRHYYAVSRATVKVHTLVLSWSSLQRDCSESSRPLLHTPPHCTVLPGRLLADLSVPSAYFQTYATKIICDTHCPAFPIPSKWSFHTITASLPCFTSSFISLTFNTSHLVFRLSTTFSFFSPFHHSSEVSSVPLTQSVGFSSQALFALIIFLAYALLILQ